ncbi:MULTISPECIES: YlmC/YmxH family sporulation protein [Clostridium]|jgi:YlmC/YmxH family sporulation protein|uniref:PRC-barrel domain-containing protein n=1 Tax=bioreactor metagenome TaxID=1076179 RepID=A0A644Y4R5_9ZZZZ|nr:YlmC/YmxH family sporulation protein [Clostridium sp. C8]KLE16475.1 YlmC/YmxH family sporulation protein [Clostridium sp. C8]
MLRGDKKRGEYYEEESKRESKYRLLSDLERYEIFNTEEAEKYDTQQALDFIIDENGNLQFIVAAVAGSKLGLFGGREYVEIPWNYVTKIGANVIVVSADKDKIKRARA